MALPSVEDVRTEVKKWLEENWNPDLTVGGVVGHPRPVRATPRRTFPEDCWGKG